MKPSDNQIANEFVCKYKISNREYEIINLIIKGKTNNEIAKRLFLSLQTVKNHIHTIFRKTGVNNRGQLIYLISTYQNGITVYNESDNIRDKILDQKRAIPEVNAIISNDSVLVSKLKFLLKPLLMLTALVAAGLFLRPHIFKNKLVSFSPSYTSIAILPFVDLSPKGDEGYFCDGLVEELIFRLTKISNLRVPSITSSLSLKGKYLNIKEIKRTLNVENILEGSVKKEGNELHIIVRLIEAKNDKHIWSEKYECKTENIFTVQNEISSAIINNLKIKMIGLDKNSLDKKYTESFEAYNSYLKGQWFIKRRTKHDLLEAIRHFKKAIEIDPEFSRAYVGLANCYILFPEYSSVMLPLEAYAKAKEAILMALDKDHALAEAHASLALILYRKEYNWEGAEIEFNKAIKKNPSYSDAHHWYALFLMQRGRFDEALKRIKVAEELDPFSLIINRNMGVILFYARRYDEAINELNKTLALDRNFVRTHYFLARAYIQESMFWQAIAELDKGEEELEYWDSVLEAERGIIYATIGRRKDARTILNSMIEKSKSMKVESSLLSISTLYFALEEDARGFNSLEEAYRNRCPMVLYLKIDPRYDRVRSDPRFSELIKKIGF